LTNAHADHLRYHHYHRRRRRNVTVASGGSGGIRYVNVTVVVDVYSVIQKVQDDVCCWTVISVVSVCDSHRGRHCSYW